MTAEYQDFSSINLRTKDGPLVVTWDTGRRCNYDCSYCPAHRHDNFSPHASLDELKKVGKFVLDYGKLINNYRNHKQLNISFTGGEPTVNPNFITFGEWLESYRDKYRDDYYLVLSLTTNGAFGKKMAESILRVYEALTISYHVEAHQKLKDQAVGNIYYFNENKFACKVNVMFHAQHFDECIDLCDRFDRDGIKYVPRMIGEEGASPHAHMYTDEQLSWMNDYWKRDKEKISRNASTGELVKQSSPNEKVKSYKENTAEVLGRPCCGARTMSTCGTDGCWTKTKFLNYRRFKDWYCSVNWYFLHIEQQTNQIFHHQTCQAKFDGTRGAIGTCTECNDILDFLKEKIQTNTMPIIKCPLGPGKLCGCGLCTPKSTNLDNLKLMLPQHLNNLDIFG